MRRTQVYLDEPQTASLDRRARAEGTTRSELIRRAIDSFLDEDIEDERAELEKFRAAVDAVAGIAPYLPPGEEYVEALRAVDAQRLRELDQRWDDR